MDSILAWRSQESVESAQDWQSEAHPGSGKSSFFFFCLMAAWLNEVVVRAVALLSALRKEYSMHIIQC